MVKERLERQMGLQQSGIPGARLIVAGELYALYVDVLISFADCIRSIRSLDSIVSIDLALDLSLRRRVRAPRAHAFDVSLCGRIPSLKSCVKNYSGNESSVFRETPRAAAMRRRKASDKE